VFLDMPLVTAPQLAMPLPGNFSWVTPILEAPWLQLVAALAPRFPPPSGTESLEEWHQDWRRFDEACIGGALVFVAVGVAVASAICLWSCGACCQCMPKKKQTAKPSPKALLFTGHMTLGFSVAGVIAYLVCVFQGLESVQRHLTSLRIDVHLAAEQGIEIGALGLQASHTLDAMMPNCTNRTQQGLVAVQTAMEHLMVEVEAYSQGIAEFPAQLDDVYIALSRVPPAYLIGPGLPLALVIACCAFVILLIRWIFAAANTCGRCCGKCCSRLGRCFLLKIGPVLFAPAIILVAATAGLEYGLGLAVGSFCQDADTNTLAYIQQFGGDVAYNASRYYLQGNGTNPLLSHLHKANATLLSMSEQMRRDMPHIQAGCSVATDSVEVLLQNLRAMERPMANVTGLLSAQHMYPYYSTMVHEKACGSVVSGLAWLVSLQLMVGIIWLPLLTCIADRLFKRQIQYWDSDAAQHLNGHVADELPRGCNPFDEDNARLPHSFHVPQAGRASEDAYGHEYLRQGYDADRGADRGYPVAGTHRGVHRGNPAGDGAWGRGSEAGHCAVPQQNRWLHRPSGAEAQQSDSSGLPLWIRTDPGHPAGPTREARWPLEPPARPGMWRG